MPTGTHFLLLETLHYYHSQQMVIRAVLCHVDLLALAIWKGLMKVGSHGVGRVFVGTSDQVQGRLATLIASAGELQTVRTWKNLNCMKSAAHFKM